MQSFDHDGFEGFERFRFHLLGAHGFSCNNRRPKKNPFSIALSWSHPFFFSSRPWWVEHRDTWPSPIFWGFGKPGLLGGSDECCWVYMSNILEIPRPRTSGRPLIGKPWGVCDALLKFSRAVWVNFFNLEANTSVLYKYPPLKTNSKHSLKIVGRSRYFLVFSRPIFRVPWNMVMYEPSSFQEFPPVSGSTNSGKAWIRSWFFQVCDSWSAARKMERSPNRPGAQRPGFLLGSSYSVETKVP